MFKSCEKSEFETKNIILNIANKIDHLADEYRKEPTTGNLIKFIHFRTDCISLIMKMIFGGLYDYDESYKIQVYLSIVTDELEIFDKPNGKSVPQPEYVEKIKKWRSKLNR